MAPRGRIAQYSPYRTGAQGAVHHGFEIRQRLARCLDIDAANVPMLRHSFLSDRVLFARSVSTGGSRPDDDTAVRPHGLGTRPMTRRGLLRGCRRRRRVSRWPASGRPGKRRASAALSIRSPTPSLNVQENAGIPAFRGSGCSPRRRESASRPTPLPWPFRAHQQLPPGRPDDVFMVPGFRMQFFAAKGLATPIDDVWRR